MKRGVKIGLACAAIVASVAFVIYWNSPERIYRRELGQLHSYVYSGNNSRLKELLERTKSSGDWGLLERSVKNYYKDRFSSIDVLKDLQADEELSAALDIESLRSNGPGFEKIIEKFQKASEKLDKAREQFNKIASLDDAVAGFAGELSDDFKNKFRSDLANEFKNEQEITGISDAFKMMQGMIDVYVEEMWLLAKNPNSWNADGDELKFSDKTIEKKYQDNLEKVKDVK